MGRPSFQCAELGNQCFAINDRGRTIATVTSQGYIDWMLTGVEQPGPLITAMRKETHLGYIFGLKLVLFNISPTTDIAAVEYTTEDQGTRLVLKTQCKSPDGKFTSTTSAALARTRYRSLSVDDG